MLEGEIAPSPRCRHGTPEFSRFPRWNLSTARVGHGVCGQDNYFLPWLHKPCSTRPASTSPTPDRVDARDRHMHRRTRWVRMNLTHVVQHVTSHNVSTWNPSASTNTSTTPFYESNQKWEMRACSSPRNLSSIRQKTLQPFHHHMFPDFFNKLSPIQPERGRTGVFFSMKSFFQRVHMELLSVHEDFRAFPPRHVL